MAELDRGAKIVLQYRAEDLVGFALPGAVLRGPPVGRRSEREARCFVSRKP